MAVIEQDVVFTTKDMDGNTVIQMPITRAENIENIMSVEQGGTGAETIAGARTNLGLATAVTGASISGEKITLIFADGTTKTLTTQDTNTSNWTISKGTNGYARDNTTGFTIQWGTISSSVFTFPITFTTCYGAVAISNTTDGTWGRPVLPHKPTITTSKATFTGVLNNLEQANSWITGNFSGTGFAWGIS